MKTKCGSVYIIQMSAFLSTLFCIVKVGRFGFALVNKLTQKKTNEKSSTTQILVGMDVNISAQLQKSTVLAVRLFVD